jgi:hypothetical protein
MATYDPQKARGKHKAAAEQPAAVDALLDAVDADAHEADGKPSVQPMATAKLEAKVDVRDEPSASSSLSKPQPKPEPKPAAAAPVRTPSAAPAPGPGPARSIAPMPAEPDRSSARLVVAAITAAIAFLVVVLLLRRRRARR